MSPKSAAQDEDDENSGGDGKKNRETAEDEENEGELLIDATCVPSDVRYPKDTDLLNEGREKQEKIIDLFRFNYFDNFGREREVVPQFI